MNRIVFKLFIGLFLLTSCRHYSDSSPRDIDTIVMTKIIKDTVYIAPKDIDKPNYVDTDTVFIVEIPAVILAPSQIDSTQTQRIMEESLWKNYIDVPFDFKTNYRTELYYNSDLSQLPYLLLSMYHPSSINNGILVDAFITMCSGAIDDAALFELGKRTTERLNVLRSQKSPEVVKKRNGHEYLIAPSMYEYPDTFTPSPISDFFRTIPYSLTHIDTLRVRLIAHNDRTILNELEKFYFDRGDH